MYQNMRRKYKVVVFVIERFSLDCRKGLVLVLVLLRPFGWLVYLLWFWFYDSQVKTALKGMQRGYTRYVKGVAFVNKRYTKGAPFLSEIVYTRVRVWSFLV